jgi:hypothetical protein
LIGTDKSLVLAKMSNNASNAEVFVYTGEGGERIIPDDVVLVRIDPSVSSIPYKAFYRRKKLAEVEQCEGVVEIGEGSFGWCDHSITKINIPTSLRRICVASFWNSLRCAIRLHDGIESIGKAAFADCIFTNFRVPPLITVIPHSMLYNCKSMFSVELFENISEIKVSAFVYCYCLRNVAFPPNAVFGDNIFIGTGIQTDTDLYQLFGTEAEIIRELQHRFDGLPIHSIVYYHSYHQGVLQHLLAAINMTSGQRGSLRTRQLDPTGNQQDCLGMTPLHIMACSSVHNLELYRLIVENYPTNLITEDRWGALPLLYAFWGAAPAAIIQFLLNSYKLLYPNHIFNWTMMVETIGRCDTPKENIENLLRVKQMHFPDQPINWEYLLNKFTNPTRFSFNSIFKERMQFLIICGMSSSVDALAFKVWRESILNMIRAADFKRGEHSFHIIQGIRARVAHFVEELAKLKDITSILELALWNLSMNENIPQEEATHHQKKIKTDELSMRSRCRFTCGAHVVIPHVLPYLIITVADEESDSYAESD